MNCVLLLALCSTGLLLLPRLSPWNSKHWIHSFWPSFRSLGRILCYSLLTFSMMPFSHYPHAFLNFSKIPLNGKEKGRLLHFKHLFLCMYVFIYLCVYLCVYMCTWVQVPWRMGLFLFPAAVMCLASHKKGRGDGEEEEKDCLPWLLSVHVVYSSETYGPIKTNLGLVGDSLTPTLVAPLFTLLSTLETFKESSVVICQLDLFGHVTSVP